MDGVVVWQDGRSVGGFDARPSGTAPWSSRGVTGTHTFAFGTVTADTPGTVGGDGAGDAVADASARRRRSARSRRASAREYTASTTANVISTAGDATLNVSDPDAVAPMRLKNGAFSLAQPVTTNLPKTLWSGPTSNEATPITFSQAIGANEPLRTGSYSKTLTFTLSTTTP